MAQAREEFERLVTAAKTELEPLARGAEEAAKRFSVLEEYEPSWSQSNIGPHAVMYFGEFETPPVARRWDREWGFHHDQPGWRERTVGEIRNRVEGQVGVAFATVSEAGRHVREVTDEHHHRLDAVPTMPGGVLADRKRDLEEHESAVSAATWLQNEAAGNHWSRDSWALSQGLWSAPHAELRAECIAAIAEADRARKLCKLADRCAAAARAEDASVGPVPGGPPAPTAAPGPSVSTASQRRFAPRYAPVGVAALLGTAFLLGVAQDAASHRREAAIACGVLGAAIGVLCLPLGQWTRRLEKTTGHARWKVATSGAGLLGIVAFVFAVLIVVHGASGRDSQYFDRTVHQTSVFGGGGGVLIALAYLFGL